MFLAERSCLFLSLFFFLSTRFPAPPHLHLPIHPSGLIIIILVIPPHLPVIIVATYPTFSTSENSMAQTQPMKDLAAARAKTSFPILDLTRYIHGSDEKIARRRELAALVANDPVFSNDKRVGLSRVQDVKQGLAMSLRLYQLKEEHKLSQEEMLTCKSENTKEIDA